MLDIRSMQDIIYAINPISLRNFLTVISMARPISVNVAEVAARANASTASVSRVLNNQAGVSEAMRSKIRAILEDDGRYSIHVSERGARIGVVVEMDKPHFSTFMSSLLTGIAEYALRNNVDISTVFVSADEKHRTDFLRLLRDRRCDGVIGLLSKTIPAEKLTKLTRANMAVMVLNGQCDHSGVGNIYTDPMLGMSLLLKHLTQLGHQDIAYLAGPVEGDSDNAQRVEVFKQYLHKHAISLGEQLLSAHQPTRYAEEAGYLQARDMLKKCPGVTAIVANNDEMARGAMLACHELGLRIPHDISVAGFDDCPSSQYTIPPLTTIGQHLNEIGYQSAECICQYLCGSLRELPRKALRPVLIVRESTAPPLAKAR